MLHKVLFNQNPLDHQPQCSCSPSTFLRISVAGVLTSAFLCESPDMSQKDNNIDPAQIHAKLLSNLHSSIIVAVQLKN